jgi:hypothetical protein
MATIITREVGATAKGSPLTNAEVDNNFINLNTELSAKANINSPTFTGTVGGITKAMVGLGSADNTADSAKNVLSATKLTAARTIGGVSFDGTANINLPGVNAEGNQSTTGNAATATALQTARTINGVSFNGSANITVADATKLPLSGGTMTGAIAFAGAQTWPTFNQSTTGSAATLTTGRTIALTGDVSYTSGSFNGSANVTGAATLASVGTAGTYTKVTTDAKGRVTSGTTLVAGDIPGLDAAKIISGVIDAARLPSYVDDVVEAANLAGFPAAGETGKIYVALDTNKVYRWSGSAYVYITSGAVDSVAGKTGVVTLVKADVGLGSVDNTADSAKPVSTAQQTALNLKANIASPVFTGNVTGLGVATGTSFNAITGLATVAPLAAGTATIGTSTLTARQDHVHPVQTTITGNAATATTLQTARTINGVSFNGSANITVADATKLPLTGGTVSGDTTFNGYLQAGGIFYHRGDYQMLNAAATGWINIINRNGGSPFINNVTYNGSAILHAGNYGSYALPLAGGTLTGGLSGTTAAFSGDVTASSKIVLGNRQPVYSCFFGGSTDLNWKKIADITFGTALYSAAAFKVDVLDADSNFGSSANVKRLTFYVTCRRSAATLDSLNDAQVHGPVADYVRAVKTATGVYELQVRTVANYRHVTVVCENVSSLSATITYASPTALVNGSTTGTIYLPTTGGSADSFVSVSVASTLAAAGAITQAGNQVLHAGNYNTYAPTLTGTGASGSWGISITGNAASISNFTTTTSTSLGTDNATSAIGYIGGITLFGQTDGALYSHVYSTAWKHNIYGDYRTGQLAVRGKNNGTWQAWRAVLDSGNYTSYSPSLTGTGASGSWGISITGNAATATTLQTARTIGGVSFNGSANINLPGVNTAGNQSTTGNAATATTLQTARTINGVSFNGSANITVADATKLPLAGGTMTGAITFAAGQTWPTFNQSTTGNAATVTNGVYTTGNQTIAGVKTFSSPIVSTGTFNINGSVGSDQPTGLYVADLGTTVGTTLNPTATAAIMGQIVAHRSVGFTSDGTYIYGFRSHSTASTYTWSSRVKLADALTTARTIGGVSFNGSANINLPGVNTAGNQNTTGNAATATALQTARTIGGVSFNGSANINLPGVNTAGNQNTTGNAATVTNGVYTTGDQTIGGSKTFSSPIRPPATAQSWIGGHRGGSAVSIATTGTTSSFHGWASQRTPLGGFALGTLNNDVYLTWATNANIDANTNTVFNALIISSAGTVTAPTFSGALSGNATTATTLQTARTINGVSFNGSANITVADSTKLPLAGGTMTGLLIGNSGTTADINAANDTGSFSIRGNASFPASVSFHRTGAYAINMGLSTSNNFVIGGWSASSNAFVMSGNGALTMLNNITAYSDERVKTNWRGLRSDYIERLAEVKHGIYDRTDQVSTQVGVSAQSLQKILEHAVMENGEGHLSVAYGNAALVSAVELAKRVIAQDEKIARLTALVEQLLNKV